MINIDYYANHISKINLDEDEFTGDSVPDLDNVDIIYNQH
jgi:hypothetical protein